ncbi:MAG: hypothetical protein JST51_04645 [Armatimonadetes bacterium]|nr:hypothetical protein [Armatimonadota bacterium]
MEQSDSERQVFMFSSPAKQKERREFLIGGLIALGMSLFLESLFTVIGGVFGLIIRSLILVLVVSGIVVVAEQVIGLLFRKHERIELEKDRIRYFKSRRSAVHDCPISDIVKLRYLIVQGRLASYTIWLSHARIINFRNSVENYEVLVDEIERLSGMPFEDKTKPSKLDDLPKFLGMD